MGITLRDYVPPPSNHPSCLYGLRYTYIPGRVSVFHHYLQFTRVYPGSKWEIAAYFRTFLTPNGRNGCGVEYVGGGGEYEKKFDISDVVDIWGFSGDWDGMSFGA
jgi:hypothetical protein